jgi:hypothetical protein
MMVEAAGVEPASRKQALQAYYKLFPRFCSRAEETPVGRINPGASLWYVPLRYRRPGVGKPTRLRPDPPTPAEGGGTRYPLVRQRARIGYSRLFFAAFYEASGASACSPKTHLPVEAQRPHKVDPPILRPEWYARSVVLLCHERVALSTGR